MKTLTVEEFRTHVDQCLVQVDSEDVLLTRDGRPWAWFRAVPRDMDADSHAFADDPEFWTMIRERRQEQGIPWEEAKRLLNNDE